MTYHFDFQPLATYYRGFAGGIEVTLFLSVASVALAAIMGLVVALGRLSRNRILSSVCGAYIEFLRNTPVLVQLVWIYYCLPIVIGVNLPGIQSAIIGLGLAESAYIAEIIRAGILAIPRGQVEAARALGFSPIPILHHVVLPQAVRIMIPPFLNSYVSLLKATALVAIIAVPDLMYVAQRVTAITFRPIEILTGAAVMYFLITYPIVLGVRVLERRVRLALA